MTLQVAFRCDASIQIGTGHVMRCLALAEGLAYRGASVSFLMRKQLGDLESLLRGNRHSIHWLPEIGDAEAGDAQEGDPAYVHWLRGGTARDAGDTQHILSHLQPHWLIVDHYGIDRKWERAVKRGCRLLVIDDLADREHDCDILLDQNLGRTERDYLKLVPVQCLKLVGPQFALLRPEFERLRLKSLEMRRTRDLKNILVNFGGVDEENYSGRTLDALKRCSLTPESTITVVMGATSPSVELVKSKAAELPCNVRVLVGVSNMAELMVESDLGIGAAGSTAWERCCVGLPSIVLALADNQQLVAQSLLDAGAALIVEDINQLDERLPEVFEEAKRKRQSLSRNAASICSGAGVRHVVKHLEQFAA